MPDANAASDPVPPDDGWRLTEAMTDHLCGLEYLIFERKGPMLERELRKSAGSRYDSASPLREAGCWLRSCLFRELRERTDLELTGHDLAKGVSAPRTRIPNSILRTAIQTEGDRPLQQGLTIAIRPGDVIDFYTDLSGSDISSEQPRVLHERLTGVRVERVRAEGEPTLHDAAALLVATRNAHAGTRLGRSERPISARPLQQDVNTWVFNYYQTASDQGRPPPKRDDDTMPACAANTRATQKQMREAISLVPNDLKRPRGGRNR